MENKLNSVLHLKGTPNDTAVEILDLARKTLEKNDKITYLKFLIVLQGRMATHNPPRMHEDEYDKIFQELLKNLIDEELA